MRPLLGSGCGRARVSLSETGSGSITCVPTTNPAFVGVMNRGGEPRSVWEGWLEKVENAGLGTLTPLKEGFRPQDGYAACRV